MHVGNLAYIQCPQCRKMSEKFQFSSVEDGKLLEYIAPRRIIYDAGDKNYKDYVMKENVWKVIFNKLKGSRKYSFIIFMVIKDFK